MSVLPSSPFPSQLRLPKWTRCATGSLEPPAARPLTGTLRRVVLFAHYDAENQVKPYVLHFLSCLRHIAKEVVFVSTSQLAPHEMAKAALYASPVMLRENVGLDFSMWKDALDKIDLASADELILTNSSLFGPVFPLGPLVDRMSAHPCHFWGMTDNFEYTWHLQSYFLVLKREVLDSPAFRQFWSGVLPLRDKKQVILSYEVGLTSHLVASGFSPGAFAPIRSWAPWIVQRRMDLERRWNATLFYPEKLLSLGMPFVKATLLRDNPGYVDVKRVYAAMSRAGYDLGLVEFDRPKSETLAPLHASARRLRALFAALRDGTQSPLEGVAGS